MRSEILQKAIKRVKDKRGDDESFKICLLIASNIRRVMVARQLKSVDLAAKLSCPESQISRWISGQENFTVETIVKIAKALDIETYVLLKPYLQEDESKLKTHIAEQKSHQVSEQYAKIFEHLSEQYAKRSLASKNHIVVRGVMSASGYNISKIIGYYTSEGSSK